NVVSRIGGLGNLGLRAGASQGTYSYTRFLAVGAVQGSFLPIDTGPADAVTDLDLRAARALKNAVPLALNNHSTVRRLPLAIGLVLNMVDSR
ncbi:MAG: hypothetical protein ACU83N_16165, partial [Gammaproteobacteria bacterium]